MNAVNLDILSVLLSGATAPQGSFGVFGTPLVPGSGMPQNSGVTDAGQASTDDDLFALLFAGLTAESGEKLVNGVVMQDTEDLRLPMTDDEWLSLASGDDEATSPHRFALPPAILQATQPAAIPVLKDDPVPGDRPILTELTNEDFAPVTDESAANAEHDTIANKPWVTRIDRRAGKPAVTADTQRNSLSLSIPHDEHAFAVQATESESIIQLQGQQVGREALASIVRPDQPQSEVPNSPVQPASSRPEIAPTVIDVDTPEQAWVVDDDTPPAFVSDDGDDATISHANRVQAQPTTESQGVRIIPTANGPVEVVQSADAPLTAAPRTSSDIAASVRVIENANSQDHTLQIRITPGTDAQAEQLTPHAAMLKAPEAVAPPDVGVRTPEQPAETQSGLRSTFTSSATQSAVPVIIDDDQMMPAESMRQGGVPAPRTVDAETAHSPSAPVMDDGLEIAQPVASQISEETKVTEPTRVSPKSTDTVTHVPNPGRGAKESVYPATRPNNPDTEIVRQAHASKAAPEPELETTPKQVARTVGIPTAAIAEQSRELRWRHAAPRAREVASEASRLLRPAVHQLTAAQVVRTGHAAKPQSQVVTTPELPVKIIPFSAIEDVAVVSKPAESAVMSQVSTEVPVAKAAIDVKADAVIEPRFEIETPKPLRVPGQITVRLEPRELGRVRIALSTGRTGVIGRMRVENNHVRQVVERDLPKLRQALLDAGVRVERFEIQTQSQARNVSMVWVGDERGQHQQFERSADQRFAEHGMTQQEREDTPSQDERRQPHMGRLLWRNPWNSMTTDANHLNLVA